ncbi:T9SS type A sorting domain-containing protein, partial [Nemorincola caseinilytica]|uniref:T9SS type A sorting domain-containing protein n=1 Tax=Nemorincola caseinilytica TaxID=2054315 RepID=UPI0031F01680
TVTYTATDVAGGTSPFYVWKKNGVTVGAGPVYSYVPANGDVITCEMTSNFPCRLQDVVSSDVKMRVVVPQAPVVTISANPGLSISEGQNVRLTAHVANGGSEPLYRWSVNGTVVSGATNAMYMSSELQDGDEVTAEVTSGGYCAGLVGTETVTMKVSPLGVGTTATGTDVRLLPNPNSGRFTVRGTVGGDAKEVNVDVVDVLGQVVYRGVVRVQNGAIDEQLQLGGDLANGMYMLNLRTATEVRTFHFVMQK